MTNKQKEAKKKKRKKEKKKIIKKRKKEIRQRNKRYVIRFINQYNNKQFKYIN